MDAPQSAAPPVPLSAAWYEAQINANDLDVQNKYAAWQQALGGLNILRQLHALALQAEQQSDETLTAP